MDARTGLPVVGMVGGGQLARMTAAAAVPLGLSLRVLAESPDDAAALVVRDPELGSHLDLEALRAFAADCDVVTFDHEHVPTEHLRALVAEGVTVHPGPDALLHAQDKLVMRERLAKAGFPVPRFAAVRDAADVTTFADGAGGWPVVLKAARGGYDGRGVWVVHGPEEAADVLSHVDSALVEERVPIVRELAALVARSPFGQGAAWPVVETVQRDGICVEVLAPAPGLAEERAVEAEEMALHLAADLGVVGVLAVELFETADGLVVNELAMRPHNSGHWTIEGARTSQFEQHVRAVVDYPFGSTALVAPAVAMANVLGGDEPGDLDARLHHVLAMDPGVRVHLYGKAHRPGRKLGHVTVLGDDPGDVRARANRAAAHLADGVE